MLRRSEKEKMLAGAPYRAGDPELLALRLRARELCQRLNALPPEDAEALQAVVDDLLGAQTGATITPPFFCDYGRHIRLGACPGVTIGAGAVIGAGSVVTRDIPAGVLAAGNPCRVIRRLDDDEQT